MSEVLIRAENVSKKFCRDLKKSLWYGVKDIAGELTGRGNDERELRPGEFWSVNDVSFELKRGECLGLIGPNGAGKSTLLKMLNGLIKPDKGRISIRGRVGALIELGAGFNPILTGRENIYVNGAVLGLTKTEIQNKFDAIVDFSGIEEFIDTPVQNYSSGMKVRLGFAVAAQLDPDVLIIDEVLAVGDMGFRTKCYNAIASMLDRSAIIFVSHSMTHVGRICDKAMVMNKGLTVFSGDVPAALMTYDSLFLSDLAPLNRSGNQLAHFDSIAFETQDGTGEITLPVGQTLKAEFWIESQIELESFVIDISFTGISGDLLAQCNNYVFPEIFHVKKGECKNFKLIVPELTLNPGIYKISALLMSSDMANVYDWIDKFLTVRVTGKSATAPQQLKGKWAGSDLGYPNHFLQSK